MNINRGQGHKIASHRDSALKKVKKGKGQTQPLERDELQNLHKKDPVAFNIVCFDGQSRSHFKALLERNAINVSPGSDESE